VAGFGRAAGALERFVYAPRRVNGVAYAAIAAGAPILAGVVLQRFTARRPVLRAAAVAAATWAVLGGTSLRSEAAVMSEVLSRRDLPAARARLSHLCARDAAAMSAEELARATVESVAENTADAVVAPLFWGAVAGLPGLLGYRAVNTLDAMVGYRSPRYAAFGWASARADDVVNWLPARCTAVLTVLLARVVGGRPRQAWRVWRRDGGSHPSPNAGQCEAAAAGALGVRLGGENVYGGEAELRPVLGEGRAPTVADIARAARLAGWVGAAAGALAVVPILVRAGRR
jgi:adenosylcobinamide-phosphate synthase